MAVLTASKPPVRTDRAAKTRDPDWAAAGWAGIAGGVLYIVLEVGPLFFSGHPFTPLRMIANIAFKILPNPSPSNTAIFWMAMGIHLPLSLIYARLLAIAIYRRDKASAIWTGVGFGLIIYLLNFYVFTQLFPWFATARTLKSIIDHAAFGGFTAWAYKKLERRI